MPDCNRAGMRGMLRHMAGCVTSLLLLADTALGRLVVRGCARNTSPPFESGVCVGQQQVFELASLHLRNHLHAKFVNGSGLIDDVLAIAELIMKNPIYRSRPRSRLPRWHADGPQQRTETSRAQTASDAIASEELMCEG